MSHEEGKFSFILLPKYFIRFGFPREDYQRMPTFFMLLFLFWLDFVWRNLLLKPIGMQQPKMKMESN
jgi:hypothetical protein